MEKQFLRRRIGTLFCIVGIFTILSVLSIYFFQPAEDASILNAPVPVLIIDPGHGGEDGGAVANDGTQEADVNLAIALRLNALSRLCGVQTVLTRSSEHIDYPTDADSIAARKVADQKQRVETINQTINGVLISIHQNWYPTASPHGAQVLYAKTSGSKQFGQFLHAQLLTALNPENRRVASPISDDIYLMRNAECPAVLVECGFLSNPDELSQLRDANYEIKLSMVMLSAYLQYFQTGWNQ